VIKKIQTLAKKTFITLGCEGMTRVDFFVTPQQKVYVNEANTIPGFTQISMYPKMWIASGMPYTNLLDKLIDLALARFNRNRVLVKARSNQKM
jgi:D-alanine-D-alanine ligase